MKKILDLLWKNRNENGMELWKEMNVADMDSYGIGITVLKKLAKKAGKNHELALELWKSNIYDAKVLAILTEEPEKVKRRQAEAQLKDCDFWLLCAAYCNNLLYRLPFAPSLAEEWALTKDPLKRRCAYLTVYQLAIKKATFHNSYFDFFLECMAKTIANEEPTVKDAMNLALISAGRRNIELNAKATFIAHKTNHIRLNTCSGPWQYANALEALTDPKLQLRLMNL